MRVRGLGEESSGVTLTYRVTDELEAGRQMKQTRILLQSTYMLSCNMV